MQGSSGDAKGNALLRFFGIETGEKVCQSILWAAPYLLFLAAGLAGLSFAFHFFFPLPLWFYVIAIGLALLNLFFFLARIRQMGIEAQVRAGKGDSLPEE